jgi:glycosyltransferase involved in cell wall biosynthesis
MGSSLGLWWFAPVLSGGGYGSEAVALLLGLHRASDSSVAVRATHHGDAMDPEHFFGLPSSSRDALEATLRASTPSAERAVVVCHSEPGAWHPALYETSRCPPAGAAVAVGRTMFETDRLDPEHVKRLNAMREVWVPTQWGLDTFARAGVRPEKLRVVPEAVDIERFDADAVAASPEFDLEARARRVLGPPLRGGGVRSTKFLSVFKWEARKAPEVLLSAYLDAFTAEDDVALFLRCDLYHETAAETATGTDLVAARIEAFAEARRRDNGATTKTSPRVYALPRVPETELPSAYAAADAFVLPSRGEGWGRPHVEAMSLGLPVIATNWSGPTAFMTRQNAYPLAVENELVALPEDSHWKTHRWAQPSEDHLRSLLKHVHAFPEEARRKGKQAAADVRRRFAPETVARDVLRHVKRLARERREERANADGEL